MFDFERVKEWKERKFMRGEDEGMRQVCLNDNSKKE